MCGGSDSLSHLGGVYIVPKHQSYAGKKKISKKNITILLKIWNYMKYFKRQ